MAYYVIMIPFEQITELGQNFHLCDQFSNDGLQTAFMVASFFLLDCEQLYRPPESQKISKLHGTNNSR